MTNERTEVERLRDTVGQLHAAVKTAQDLAATRLMEVERLQTLLIRVLEDGEPSQDLLQEIDEAVTEPAHEPPKIDWDAVEQAKKADAAAFANTWGEIKAHAHEPFEQRLRTPQGEPALTHVDGLPGTREPVSQQPQGIAGESPALFNCGYDPTSHGWVIREGSREGVLVACFLREEDANSYVIPAHALKSQGASRDAPGVVLETESERRVGLHVCDPSYPVGDRRRYTEKSAGASRDASPADLVGALQDVVHTDPGPVRAAHAVRDASPGSTEDNQPDKWAALRGDQWTPAEMSRLMERNRAPAEHEWDADGKCKWCPAERT